MEWNANRGYTRRRKEDVALIGGMKYRLNSALPEGPPVITQVEGEQKTTWAWCSPQKRYLRILVILFSLSSLILASLLIFFYTLPEDDHVTNDLDHLKGFRRDMEEKIDYWNKHFINKDANSTSTGGKLTQPEKGFVFMSIVNEISRMSQLPYKNISSSQYHKRLFHDIASDLCQAEVTCPTDVILSPYRTIDGSCNNLYRPQWGMAGRSQKRILRPVFEDDIGSPRSKGVDGRPLPSPRLISNLIHRDNHGDRNDTGATAMVMGFGQFFSHDLVFTPVTKASDGDDMSCCTDEAKSTKGPLEACRPIDIPAVDEHFRPNSCMNFTRSAPSVCDSCSTCQRGQINGMTSFIDGSHVYGASKKRCNELREFKQGLLKATNLDQTHHLTLLPRDPKNTRCTLSNPKQFCFYAGDNRPNVVPSLSSLHTMFMREHNRIATQLTRINPHWSDELLFQESRKILIAVMQHIAYSEYLPVILGEETMAKYGLKVSHTAYNDVYDRDVDPRISSSFGTAAFRFAHSTVPNYMKALSGNYHMREEVPIEKTFHNPNMTFSHCDGLVRWLVNDTAVRTDGLFGHGVRNMLFHNNRHTNTSLDLASLNIQRGRDHGLAPYNYWRHFCELPVIKPRDFNTTGSRVGHFSASVADIFRKAYRHPDDIDLFSGAMREIRLYNAHVGPTFACLLAKEFQRLKTSDRFYYENPPKPGMPFVGFTEDQLVSIKKVRLSKIVCETMHAPKIQHDVFRPSTNDSNPLVACSELPTLDLKLWKDKLM